MEQTRSEFLVSQSEELRKRAQQLKEKWTARSENDGLQRSESIRPK